MSSIAITPSINSSLSRQRPAAVRPREVRSQAHGQVRLTRRGRVVLFGAALLLVLAAAVALGAGSGASSHQVPVRTTTTVVVGAGDTLWAIASDVAGVGNVAHMVAKIQKMNGLDTALLQQGQVLRVPKA